MSFSAELKKELCRSQVLDRELLRAELYGMLIFGKSFSENKIVFTTESKYAASRLAVLLQNLYMPIIERQNALRTKKNDSRLYRISLIDEAECKKSTEIWGHYKGQPSLRVNRANLPGEELYSAFLRGAFLSCGSVADPMKNYHAEFCVPHRNLSLDLCKILSEVTECSFNPKTVTRSGSYIVYFKGSEQICDLLTYIGAPVCAMEIMGTKAIKQVRNNVNRRINSEVANIGKIASASARQLEAIKKIDRMKGIEVLPPDLKEVAYIRLENPEMSLKEIGQSLSPPISRSGANHRIMRLLEYAESLETVKNG